MSDELQFAHYPFEDEDLPESWAIMALEKCSKISGLDLHRDSTTKTVKESRIFDR